MLNFRDSRVFYESGNYAQYEYVLSLYKEALRIKSETKKKPAELQKLDNWFQEELPRILQKRNPDKFLTHDEIVQCIKWKLARGKFRPKLKELVQMNTPRVVQVETKKAFRQLAKKNDVQSAIQALSNLKGVGPAFASAVLAAMAPEKVPFMADECIMAINNVVTIDYTLREYMQYVDQVNSVCQRLNKEAGGSDYWTPHRVELSLWTHYVLADVNDPSLDKIDDLTTAKPGGVVAVVDEGAKKEKEEETGSPVTNGNGHGHGHDDEDSNNSKPAVDDEDSRSSAVVDDNGEATASSASSAVDDESSRDSAGGKLGSPKEGFVYHGENGDASNDSGVMNHVGGGAAIASMAMGIEPAAVAAVSEDSHSSLPDAASAVPPVVHELKSAAVVDSSSDSAVDLVCDNTAAAVADDEPEAKRPRLEIDA